MSQSNAERAAQFRSLHHTGPLLVLPNAWDAGSARVAEDCGATAIATSSAAVAWSHGFPDGEKLPREMLLALTVEIVRTVKVPVSVDSEAGYSSNPEEAGGFVVSLARAGAVGINLEDDRAPAELLAAKIKAIKSACKREGLDVFVNARADVILRQLVPAEKSTAEIIARGRLYKDAGADGFFVPAIVDLVAMKAIAEAVSLPLNVLTTPNLPVIAELRTAGVRRLSAGSNVCRAALGAARRATKELLESGSYGALYAEAEGLPNMNGLFART